jgi:hypothetical protein
MNDAEDDISFLHVREAHWLILLDLKTKNHWFASAMKLSLYSA